MESNEVLENESHSHTIKISTNSFNNPVLIPSTSKIINIERNGSDPQKKEISNNQTISSNSPLQDPSTVTAPLIAVANNQTRLKTEL